MILNISRFQYLKWDKCKIVLWCATVFHNCHSLVVRGEARIAENCLKCHDFVQNWYKKSNFFFKKLRHLWLVLRQLWLIKIATIVVGVTTIVVFCDNCGWCCDNCGWLRQLWTLRQLWSHHMLFTKLSTRRFSTHAHKREHTHTTWVIDLATIILQTISLWAQHRNDLKLVNSLLPSAESFCMWLIFKEFFVKGLWLNGVTDVLVCRKSKYSTIK